MDIYAVYLISQSFLFNLRQQTIEAFWSAGFNYLPIDNWSNCNSFWTMGNLALNIRLITIQVIDNFHTPFRRYIPLETFRYAATGGFNTALDIFLYFICYNFVVDKQVVDLQIISISPYIAAFLLVFPVTFFTGFLLAKYITFTNSDIRGRVQLIRYMISVSGSIFLNYVFLKVLVEFGGLWPTLAKLITTGIVVVYSYFVQKFYTFKTVGLATSWIQQLTTQQSDPIISKIICSENRFWIRFCLILAAEMVMFF